MYSSYSQRFGIIINEIKIVVKPIIQKISTTSISGVLGFITIDFIITVRPKHEAISKLLKPARVPRLSYYISR